MSNLQQATEQDPAMIDLMNRWAIMGKVVKNLGLQLQVRGQSIIAGLILAPTVEQVVEAEKALLQANKSLTELENDRKATTSKFDAVTQNLMIAEKTVKTEIEKAKSSLLTAKTTAATLAAATMAKSDELKRAREAISNYLVKADASFRCNITETVATLFAQALETDVKESDISDWIQEKKSVTFKIADFTVKQPTMKPNLNTPESIQAIWDELTVNVTQEAEYLLMFYKELDEKFAFYGISLKNKAAAIKMTVANVAQECAKIAAEVSASETGNKLAALAVQVDVVSEPAGRALKSVYEIDVPDTEQGAIAIMAAYIGNLSACRSGTRVTSYRKLTVQQMANALINAKIKDPNFASQGIIFKSKSKL